MISIITYVLDEEKVLDRTLRRLTELKKKHLVEITVVDEGSKDNSIAIAEKYADEVFYLPSPGTIAQSRDVGSFISKGDIYLFIDPDVVLPLNTIEVVNEAFADLGVVAASADSRVWEEEETFADRFFHELQNFRYRVGIALGFPQSCGEFQAYRADAFRKAGRYRDDFYSAEDIDLMFRLRLQGKVVRLPKGFYVRESPRRYRMFGYIYTFAYWSYLALRAMFKMKQKPYRRISH